MDIQPVIITYKAMKYIWADVFKTEDVCSYARTQVVKEAWNKSLSNYKQMRLIAKGYATKSKCNVQEAVYQIILLYHIYG